MKDKNLVTRETILYELKEIQKEMIHYNFTNARRRVDKLVIALGETPADVKTIY